MPLLIPTSSDPDYEQVTTLDGTTYRLRFIWNQRSEFWTLNLYDVEGDPIVTGIKIVNDIDLLKRQTKDTIPPGAIVAIDTNDTGVPPGLEDLGSRILLVYYEESELG